jgi:hypothetical protein
MLSLPPKPCISWLTLTPHFSESGGRRVISTFLLSLALVQTFLMRKQHLEVILCIILCTANWFCIEMAVNSLQLFPSFRCSRMSVVMCRCTSAYKRTWWKTATNMTLCRMLDDNTVIIRVSTHSYGMKLIWAMTRHCRKRAPRPAPFRHYLRPAQTTFQYCM